MISYSPIPPIELQYRKSLASKVGFQDVNTIVKFIKDGKTSMKGQNESSAQTRISKIDRRITTLLMVIHEVRKKTLTVSSFMKHRGIQALILRVAKKADF